jgi:biopolymer transport protein ExbD
MNNTEKYFLLIKSDRDAKVGFLVNVIDEVRLSEVKNFSIVTERR